MKQISTAQAELGSLLTVTEVADILQIHSVTVYRLVKRGVIPGFKIGNAWRISRESLDLMLSTEQSLQLEKSSH